MFFRGFLAFIIVSRIHFPRFSFTQGLLLSNSILPSAHLLSWTLSCWLLLRHSCYFCCVCCRYFRVIFCLLLVLDINLIHARVGQYCPSGSTAAQPCPAGSYCSSTNVIAACTGGNYCPEGSTGQTPCPSGSYCPYAIAQPITCAGTIPNCNSYCASSNPQPTCHVCHTGFAVILQKLVNISRTACTLHFDTIGVIGWIQLCSGWVLHWLYLVSHFIPKFRFTVFKRSTSSFSGPPTIDVRDYPRLCGRNDSI